MKKQWVNPLLLGLRIKNTKMDTRGNDKDKCSFCNHNINHPNEFLNPGNHKGWCKLIKPPTGS